MVREIYDVAKWFTKKNGGVIEPKKMQKLCYYAQAWHLALFDTPMFKNNFEAWVHGPVCRQLWDTFRDISYREIKLADFSEKQITTEELCAAEVDFLERVWTTYGEFNGYQLEQLTHQEKPWVLARGDLRPYETSNAILSNDLMKQFYRGIYTGEAGASN